MDVRIRQHLVSAALLLCACSILVPARAAVDPPPVPGACDEVGFTRGDYLGDRSKLKVVEEYHFKPHHESLIRLPGESVDALGANLSYTLRSFPNHHRALLAMMRLSERTKLDQPRGADRPVECFLRRAVKFRPDDTVARMLYVDYLIKKSRRDEALAQLAATEPHARDNAFSLYNMGLLYVELQDWDHALEMAHRAQSMGFTRTDLRDRLTRAGKWRDPPPDGTAPAASPPASAASAASIGSAPAADAAASAASN
jgi:hypothetical protein